jgi:anti-sigma B factor antagonist
MSQNKEESMAGQLEVDVRSSGGASVLDVRGDITAESEQTLMDAYQKTDGAKAIVLNFTGLEYMNSGGIGLLVTMLVRANRQKQQLLACGLTEHYKQIFELTRLDEAITIHDSEDEAVKAAGG